MSIDEAIKQLETYTIPCGKYKVAYDLAVEIMRKYQKIEQIIKDHDNDRIPEDYWYIDKIREVIGDGTN